MDKDADSPSPGGREIISFSRTRPTSENPPPPSDLNRRFLRKDCREMHQRQMAEQNRQMDSLNYWKCQFSENPEAMGLQPMRQECFVRIGRKKEKGKKVDAKAALSPKETTTSSSNFLLKKLSPIQNSPHFHHHHHQPVLHRQATQPAFLQHLNGQTQIHLPNGLSAQLVQVPVMKSPPRMHPMELRRGMGLGLGLGMGQPQRLMPEEVEEGENALPAKEPQSRKQEEVVEDDEEELIFPIEI